MVGKRKYTETEVTADAYGRRKDKTTGKIYTVYAVAPKDKSLALKGLRQQYKTVLSKGTNMFGKNVIWVRGRK